MTLRRLFATLADWLLGCRHRHLGVWTRDPKVASGKDYQPCVDCGFPVLTKKVQTGPDQFIKPPVRTQEAKPAAPEEPQPTGLEREWLKDMGVRG